jgi:oligopeptide/dipeptide ABC transporter ATP-binding protein
MGRRMAVVLRTPTGALAVVILVALSVLALVGPAVWGEAAERVDVAHILEGSTARHPLGTDNLGRDVLARMLVATRPSLLLAVLAVVIAAGIGIPFGILPTVLGRRAARVVNGLIDFSVAFPALLLAIFLAVVLGAGAYAAVFAIGVAAAPSAARLAQTLAASVAAADYVAAATVVGVGRARVLARHVLPNIGEPLILNLTIAVGQALLAMSGLSFLGLGMQPPAYDWGRMLDEGLERVYVTPVAALGPGLAIIVAGVAFNGLGEALAHAVSGRPVGRWRRGWLAGIAAEPPSQTAPAPATAPCPAIPQEPVLVVDGLSVTFPATAGPLRAVRELSFTVAAGEIVGLVGESGSGKSLTAAAIGQLVPPPGVVTARGLHFLGHDLLAPPGAATRRLLGTSMAMVFQDPTTSLNPAVQVGRQLAEVAEVHGGADRRSALQLAVQRLRSVRISSPHRRARQYPHQLSGGMRQRAMIAMGLMGTPRLIVADEPTSALDVTVQQEILRLLRGVTTDTTAAVLLITHDIAVVAETCHRVLVMYGGRIVEDLPVGSLVTGAAHPYTRALLASVPDLATDRDLPLATIPGRPVQPDELAAGCSFAPRCGFAGERCRTARPLLQPVGAGHLVACWHPQTTLPPKAPGPGRDVATGEVGGASREQAPSGPPASSGFKR